MENKMEKPTDILEHELRSIKNKEQLAEWIAKQERTTFGTYLNELCDQYQKKLSNVINDCVLSKSYIYKCFNDDKNPSKEAVVKIGVTLGITIDEMNKLLKCAGHKELYPKKVWDAIILFGLQNRCTSYEIDELLIENGIEKGLLNEGE